MYLFCAIQKLVQFSVEKQEPTNEWWFHYNRTPYLDVLLIFCVAFMFNFSERKMDVAVAAGAAAQGNGGEAVVGSANEGAEARKGAAEAGKDAAKAGTEGVLGGAEAVRDAGVLNDVDEAGAERETGKKNTAVGVGQGKGLGEADHGKGPGEADHVIGLGGVAQVQSKLL